MRSRDPRRNGVEAKVYSDPSAEEGNLYGSAVESACRASLCGSDGRVICVGSPAADGGSGGVDCFSETSGDHILTIPNPEPAPGALFGVTKESIGTKLYVAAGARDRAGAVYEIDMTLTSNSFVYLLPFVEQDALFGSFRRS